ncbi:MAG: hypothetical protein A2089_03855 [Elusimicrobia bacterium GWD2_63_28]|nr:MAG: hypothetical protein A2089_03855 [Elusimicrobia bacterium GWD2_63_28]
MSNSEFFDGQIKQFHKEFPQSEGWQIFKNNKDFLSLVPELIDTKPKILKSGEISRDISHESHYSETKEVYEFSMRKTRWLGTYRLLWDNKPIIIRSLYYETHRQIPYFLVAVKDSATLSNFYEAILKFELEVGKKRGHSVVQTVDSEDISLSGMSWDNLILPTGMVEEIRTGVETFFKAEDVYKRFSIPYKRGFVFSGPPGCGKTMTAKTILGTMHHPSFLITSSAGRDYMEYKIKWAFEAASRHAPAILLIEELEKFSEASSISTVLNLMDGLSSMKGILAIATTNYPEKIDPALLLRPSRFDRVWNFALPDYECRLRMLQKKANGHVNANILEKVAKFSSGFSMAYVQEIFASAISMALREGREVSDVDLLNSVEMLKKQIKSAPKSGAGLGEGSQKMGFIPADVS